MIKIINEANIGAQAHTHKSPYRYILNTLEYMYKYMYICV